MIDLAKLSAPFPPDQIDWRVGSTNSEKTRGMALAYIDSRAVMDRLDEVCGVDGWQCEYSGIGADKTCCRIGIKIGYFYEAAAGGGMARAVDAEWVWKADGAGDTDFEAAKGAFSDAFKRAAVKWGIGRYLYGLDSPWVEIEPMGKSFKIKASEMSKLKAALKSETQPGTVTANKDKARAFLKDVNDCVEYDQLIPLLASAKDFLFQLQTKRPEWWFGDGKDSPGIAARIEAKKKELAGLERV